MDSKAQIKSLFKKFVNNTCSRQELEMLLEYVRDQEGEQEWKRLLDDLWERKQRESLEVPQFSDAYKGEVFEKLMARAGGNERNIRLYHKSKAGGHWRKIAAVVSMLLVSAFVIYGIKYQAWFGEQTAVYLEKINVPGQKSTITLSDGSTVRLNADSKLTYPEKFTGGTRELVLEGEAFFMVSKDPQRPFIVRSGDLATKVLGTSFNIRAFPREKIEVTVATGKVQVASIADAMNETAALTDDSEEDTLLLTPGKQAVFNPSDNTLTEKQVNLPEYLAWKDGILRFNNISFAEAAKKLSRWYGIRVMLDNEKLKNCRIQGEYKDQSLENVLKTLEFTFGIGHEITGEGLLITGKGCD